MGHTIDHLIGGLKALVNQSIDQSLTMSRVTLDHLIGGLEAGVGHFGHGQLLVIGLRKFFYLELVDCQEILI